jgi:hypothetical protein
MRVCRRWGRAVFVLAILLVTVPKARAAVLNFESQPNGKKLDNQYSSYQSGLTITADNFRIGGPDYAITFDTRLTGTHDEDLEDPWMVGNLAPFTVLGNVMVIAENSVDLNHDGLFDTPDDEGSRPAGAITIHFKQAQASFGMDLIDVDGPIEYGPTSGYVSFRNSGKEVRRVGFGDFVTPTSAFYDPTIVWGNRSANRIKPITAASLGVRSFNEVLLNYGGSMAVDNIVFAPVGVPEPGTIGVLAVGCVALAARRRR